MNKNQQKEKTSKSSAWSNLLIILLIAIIMVTSSIGIFAWAKYTSATDGNATAQVAKWSFKVVDGVPETSDVIEFAFTRTDGYEHVAEGRLAPGTFGEFEIGIDARGTETILEYIIDVELENKPTYLKFYKDEDRTEGISATDGKFSVKGFMSLEDVKEIRTEKIYWEWPYENGDDVTDTNDAGKLVTMQVAVTGYEVLEQSSDEEESLLRLADVVEVGDYVDYNASSNGVKTFTSSDCLAGSSISDTISTADDFNSEAPAQWRVLSVDKESGTVEIMSVNQTEEVLILTDEDGFLNSLTLLNNIGAIYGEGKGAIGGRSITLEDVEQYSSFDKTSASFYKKFGETETYTSGNFFKEKKDENGNVLEYEKIITVANSNSPITMTHTFYRQNLQNYFENSIIYNMLFTKDSGYWLASHSVFLFPSSCDFYLNYVTSNGVDGCGLYGSSGNKISAGYRVIPVVSLNTNIQTIGQDDNGVWQLKID